MVVKKLKKIRIDSIGASVMLYVFFGVMIGIGALVNDKSQVWGSILISIGTSGYLTAVFIYTKSKSSPYVAEKVIQQRFFKSVYIGLKRFERNMNETEWNCLKSVIIDSVDEFYMNANDSNLNDMQEIINEIIANMIEHGFEKSKENLASTLDSIKHLIQLNFKNEYTRISKVELLRNKHL